MRSAIVRALAIALFVAVALFARAAVVHAAEGDLLPDLDQEAPAQLQIASTGAKGERHWWLGFSSAVSNVGAGPLTINGNRPDASTPEMTADQVISGPMPSLVPDVGRLRYVRSPDHQHWHLMHFERYELRRAGSTSPVVRDRKSGFCLGDRYRVENRPVLSAPPRPVITGHCGLRQPDLLQISEGISPGYGDVYNAYLEYQDLPLDGLHDGRYVLVQRVNSDGRLRESSNANNSSSLLLDIRWRDGTPTVRRLRSCPDSARCDQRPKATATTGPRVTTVARGLEIPWDIAFLPGGGALVTERPGRVRLLTPGGRLQRTPVAGLRVSSRGEGGLLGIVLDPAFASNRQVYLYFTAATGMRLERWR